MLRGRPWTSWNPYCSQLFPNLAKSANGRIIKCLKSRKMLVDVTGIEPVTPCLQNKTATPPKSNHFNHSIENSRLNSSARVWLDVRRCAGLNVGSLQKSLQSSDRDESDDMKPNVHTVPIRR